MPREKIPNSKFQIPNERAFTLVELLVAIVIIGIVFGVVITSNSAIQRGARDAKRQSDLRTIQGALEQYHSDTSFYPDTLAQIASPTAYLAPIPSAPTPGNNYSYAPLPATPTQCTGNCTRYCLNAQLENTPNPVYSGTCSPLPAPYNFAVTSP